MSTPISNLFLAALVLAALQAAAAIPWAWAFDGRRFRDWITDTKVLGYLGGGTLGLAVILAFYIRQVGDLRELERTARNYGPAFPFQLIPTSVSLPPRPCPRCWPR